MLVKNNKSLRLNSSKKAIGSLVMISLLLVSSILGVFYLNDWFYLYQDDFEQMITAKDIDEKLSIQKIEGTYIYLENDLINDLSINSIKINDKECLVKNKTIDMGLIKVDIGGCTKNLEAIVPQDVSIITSYGFKDEFQSIRAPVILDFIISYQTELCDFSSGYVRLFGISDIDNAHAEITSSNIYTYHVCARHLDYTLGTAQTGNTQRLFSLVKENNSAIFIDKGSIIQEPTPWYDVHISSSGGAFSYQVNTTSPGDDFVCLGSIDKDDIMGSHIGACNSSLPDKIWVQLI